MLAFASQIPLECEPESTCTSCNCLLPWVRTSLIHFLIRTLFCNIINIGGEGGIRTHGTVTRTPIFKTGALNQLDHLSVSCSISVTPILSFVNNLLAVNFY